MDTMLVGILSAELVVSAGCKKEQEDFAPPTTLADVPGHDRVSQDSTHKESPRLVTAEAYMRTYLHIFGGLTSLQTQTQLAAGGSGLFDSWNSYLGALGLPNYITDLPRGEQTNTLMVATFERLGVALCDKALEKDLKSSPVVVVDRRLVFAFDASPAPMALNRTTFDTRFDVLHRTFLGYPAKLAPTDRAARFYELFHQTVCKHPAYDGVKDKNPTCPDKKPTNPVQNLRLTPAESGWAAMCYGLVRHPEFHLY